MNQVVIFYNPYMPELKISVNGKKISSYSSLMSFQHQRIDRWADFLMKDIYREVNSEYEMVCISNEFACRWLKELAERDSHCVDFFSQTLPIARNVYERLEKLEMLGCDAMDEDIIIPVVDLSNADGMTEAVYEILEEQGGIELVSEQDAVLSDYPLVNINLKTFDADDELPEKVPAVIALCKTEEDYYRLDTDAPVYALVMSARSCFVKRSGNFFYFEVDPDDICKFVFDIIEEEALCPALSDMSYYFPESARAFLTEDEKEELELICQAKPLWKVSVPSIFDTGRAEEIQAKVFPRNSESILRVVTNDNAMVEMDGYTLCPIAPGIAEISVYADEDPYPVMVKEIEVRKRSLINAISLFPSKMYMPVGEKRELKLTISPSDAENENEIRWTSADSSVAAVDEITGLITAKACGQCKITAYTREAYESIYLEVQPDIEDIVCPSGFMELQVGEQREWKFHIVPENAYGKEFLKVLCSDKNIAEYRGGYVIGKNAGECKMFIKNQSGSITRELRVLVKKNGRFW